MAQQLGVLTVLPEDPSSVPSIFSGILQLPDILFSSHCVPTHIWHMTTETDTHTCK